MSEDVSYQVVITAADSDEMHDCLLAGFDVVGCWPGAGAFSGGPPFFSPVVYVALRRQTPEGQQPGLVDHGHLGDPKVMERLRQPVPEEWRAA